MASDFNEKEQIEIMRHAALLIKNGYISGINHVNSINPLPQSAVIIHYLQDSQKQIDHLVKNLSLGQNSILQLPRITYYLMDPAYVNKPDFKKEYAGALFVDDSLRPRDIDDVLRCPGKTIIKTNEWDLIIPCDDTSIVQLVKGIVAADVSGPERWLHPAIIIKSGSAIPSVSGFAKRDYASLGRSNAEFYSIISDASRKNRLIRKMEKICQELQRSSQTQLLQEQVLWFTGQINPELDKYINENQWPLEPES